MLELEALQRPEGGAQQVDAVEHHAPRNPGDPYPGRRLGLEDARPLRCAREREPELERLAAPLQEVEIEVQHVPAENEIGIGSAHPVEEAPQGFALVAAADQLEIGGIERGVADHEHAAPAPRAHRDRVELAVEARGLDVDDGVRETGPE